MAGPAPETVERFRRDAEALAGGPPGRLGIAVSGGPDSLALLFLAWAAWPRAVRAATVDHRLRAESRAEAEAVGALCARLDIPHRILTAAEPIQGNVQAGARTLRYRLLGAWAEAEGIGFVATAHHADDQAETLLMRLNRGAGLSGLAAIRPEGPLPGGPASVRLIRPLLGWRREELGAIVAAAGIAAAADPANSDPRYDRSRIRGLLARSAELNAESLARSAAALGEAETALDWTASLLQAERIARSADGVSLDPHGLPRELRRRLLLAALAEFGAEPPRGEALQRLLATLESGGTATLAGVRCSGGSAWRFAPAPPRRG